MRSEGEGLHAASMLDDAVGMSRRAPGRAHPRKVDEVFLDQRGNCFSAALG